MYVYMYVCMYVYMYVCMYICMYVCMYMCMYVQIRLHVCMYICMYVEKHTIHSTCRVPGWRNSNPLQNRALAGTVLGEEACSVFVLCIDRLIHQITN